MENIMGPVALLGGGGVVRHIVGAVADAVGGMSRGALGAANKASGAWSGGCNAASGVADSNRLQQTMKMLQDDQENQIIRHMQVSHDQAMFNNAMEHAQQQTAQQMQHNRALTNNAKEIFTTAQEDAQSWLKSSTQKLSQTAAA